MDLLAKQNRQDKEDSRLVRPNPKFKPPRRDLRREHVNSEDPDKDDTSDKKDRSRNYKNIGGSLRERVVERVVEAKDRIPAKSRETGETVMISPDTLKEQPGKYEALEQEEDEGGKSGKPAEPKEPAGEAKEPAKPESKSERDKYYQQAGDKLWSLAGKDPRLQSKIERFKDPNSEVAQLAKENPDLPANKLFPNVDLPPELKTIGDISEALGKASPPSKKKPGKEGPGKKEPKSEPKAEAPEKPKEDPKKPEPPQTDEGEKKPEEGEPAKPEPTRAEKAGIPEPKRRPVNAAEREEAVSALVSTFPPSISAELIAKNMHPDDVRSLVNDYTAATKGAQTRKTEDLIEKASSFFQTDPSKVEPPTTGRNAAGQRVSFDELTPEEQAEATRKHQLQIAAMSLAAQQVLTDKFASKGKLTGKDRVPRPLASMLANTILTKTPAEVSNKVAADTYDAVLKSGMTQPISDRSAQNLLSQMKRHPAAHAAAKAYFQANDYGLAKQKFLKGDDDTISEWQSPREILKGLAKAGRYFDKRNALYGDEGSTHPSSTYFRSKVMARLHALDPKKARIVSAKLPELDEQEFKDRHRKWEARYQDWAAKELAHDKELEAYTKNPRKGKPPGEFTETEPVEPSPPPSLATKSEGPDMWDTVFEGPPKTKKPEKKAPSALELPAGEKKEVAQAVDDAVSNPPKLASVSTYPVAPVMGTAASKTSVYHGVDPYAYGPLSYPGWLQAHQRDFGPKDFDALLGMAQDWLKSPVLTAAVDGMVPDARFRAALDLAIYDSPYNGGINPVRYNQLLARLAGKPEPGRGETLLTVRKEASGYNLETRHVVAYGQLPVGREVLAAVETRAFYFNDESGASRGDGTVGIRVVKQGSQVSERQAKEGLVPEALFRVDFPEGSAGVALKTVEACLAPFGVHIEAVPSDYVPTLRTMTASPTSTFSPTPSDSTGGSRSMKASTEIRRFATQVSASNPKLAFEMTAFADRLAEEEKSMPPWLKDKVEDKEKKDEGKKEASLTSLRSLIIKQASSVEGPARAPWMPVLQALKDLK